MKFLVTGLSLILTIVHAHIEEFNILDDVLVHPIPAPMNIQKRDTLERFPASMKRFIEEKLTEHSQALEHIVKIIDQHEDVTKKLLEHFSKNTEQPELPIKIESPIAIPKNSRRSYETVEHPVLRMGNSIHKFGKLTTDLLLKEIQSDTDPTPLIEVKPDLPIKFYRRSFDDNEILGSNEQNKREINPWCEIALLCKDTGGFVCGLDDNFGYGKFNDICHMLNVNCYYRYNFILLHTCHPTL